MSGDPQPGGEVEQTEYIVVLRARSSAKFLPEEGYELVVNVPGLNLERVRIRAFSRWVKDGSGQLPRELIVEVRGRAGSLDEAAARFPTIARPIATMVGFVANVRVGPLEVNLAYDSTPTSDDREFLETFVPDETGAVSEGRIIRLDLLEAVCAAYVTLAMDSPRINRALRQYELALREWYVGGEWLALNHLWIAAENLTKAVIRKTIAARSISEEQLAHEYGLVTDDPQRPRWRDLLGAQIREKIIFGGDTETYKAAKDASDGLEHGIWELDRVAEHALKAADKTFEFIRRTLIEFLELPAEIRDELIGIKPMDVQSTRRVIRGRLIGIAENPAMEGQMYPTLEWSLSIDSVVREGSTFRMQQKARVTVRTHPAVSFRPERFEVYGRLENGRVPIQPGEADVTIENTPSSPSRRLLESVMPLVDAAAASGTDHKHSPPSMVAFNMFGQAVAFFQSIRVLVDAHLPVETLPSLKGLVLVAARFEQMADQAGPRLGIAVRALLDTLQAIGTDADLVESRSREIADAARSQGVKIPDGLVAPESTSIYLSLRDEMNLADLADSGTYGTAALHVQRMDVEQASFHVVLEPGPLTDLVCTAAVIAILGLLKLAAPIFGWSVPTSAINEHIAEARGLNAAAAELDLTPSSLTTT